MIADEIKRLRQERGWSADRLADLLDMPREAVQRWEAGETPDAGKVAALAKLFGVTADSLLGIGRDSIGLEGLDREEREILRRLADCFGRQNGKE